jgi:hypothetical protein
VLAPLVSSAGDAAGDDKAWSVSNPPGDWQALTIDTREFSWATST